MLITVNISGYATGNVKGSGTEIGGLVGYGSGSDIYGYAHW